MMKVAIGLIIFSMLFGYCMALKGYNQELTEVKLKILINLCAKNDGLKTMRRSFTHVNRFVIQCNDTAIFDNVSFLLIEDIKQVSL